MNLRLFALAGAAMGLIGLWSAALTGQVVLVEAESFDDPGGWVIDQQAMDRMGSPYLLAHGIGHPVAAARTQVQFPAPGKYRVFVRTRDWVAPWNPPVGGAGRFQVLVDGKTLATTFGTEGADWHWQDGGIVQIAGTNITLGLHDLTGFEGRCDAIVFARDTDFVPPDDGGELARFRRKALHLPDIPPDAGEFDFVVVGGGIAGTCAGVSAARLGLQVALIQDRPVLGGNNSSEVRVHLNGQINLPPYPALGDIVKELDSGKRGNAQPAANYDDAGKLAVVQREKNVRLFVNMHVFKVEKIGNRISSVVAQDIRTAKELRFAAPLFADCTGDGTVGFLAGADYRVGRESKAETGESLAPEKPDKMTLGASVQWYAVEADAPTSFPDCPWALQFTEEGCQYGTRGDWDWELGFNRDQIDDVEYIRDCALRAMYGNWAFLKNSSQKRAEYANKRLEWVGYVAGKRESRRLLGDVILQQQDIQNRSAFPDVFVTTTWTIDLHYPDPANSKLFPGEEFRSIAKHTPIEPYAIPYRSLYSRNIDNLFMAGRNISVTHIALGTTRVMRTCGMMGELVGMAASLCKKHGITPRGVYQKHLDELKALARLGVGKNAGAAREVDFDRVLENARLANEGFVRCRKFVAGWLSKADPQTGLIPRNLNRDTDIWNAQDCAADNYPFMVLTAAITDRELLEGRMLDMLRTEAKLTSRIGNLPDTYSFSKQAFHDSQPDIARIIFGSAEYAKDGLLPITELLGETLWSRRMLDIVDDIWRYAPIETPFGKIPSTSQEVNGDLLQVISRIYWFSGDAKYLDWAVRLGDYYLLGRHHPTRDENSLRLRDHGCEIVSGLCELYATVNFARPEKKNAYQEPIHQMLDRILEVGVNEHGLFYNSINPQSGAHDTGLADTWGYDLNGYYTVYLIDKTEPYRQAVLKALSNLNAHYRNYKWEGSSADGYADSIEGAINLHNREPTPSAAEWIDAEIRQMWSIQKPDGIIEGWHGDGNFARTTLMYCLWKTQGLTIRPWRQDVFIGAIRDGDRLKIAIRTESAWQGRLICDTARHKTVMRLPIDWPRINQFPQWFTVEPEGTYCLDNPSDGSRSVYTGRRLREGVGLDIKANETRRLILQPTDG